jgi:hypothetical protein
LATPRQNGLPLPDLTCRCTVDRDRLAGAARFGLGFV